MKHFAKRCLSTLLSAALICGSIGINNVQAMADGIEIATSEKLAGGALESDDISLHANDIEVSEDTSMSLLESNGDGVITPDDNGLDAATETENASQPISMDEEDSVRTSDAERMDGSEENEDPLGLTSEGDRIKVVTPSVPSRPDQNESQLAPDTDDQPQQDGVGQLQQDGIGQPQIDDGGQPQQDVLELPVSDLLELGQVASPSNMLLARKEGTVTYHLNIPNDNTAFGNSKFNSYKEGQKFKDFTYTVASEYVLDLNEINAFTNDAITINKDSDNALARYLEGNLGTNREYYFAGWSTNDPDSDNLVERDNISVDYGKIDYPVVEIVGLDTKKQRNIYSHSGVDGAGTPLFRYPASVAERNLYAVWVPEGSSGLLGYAMTREGAHFDVPKEDSVIEDNRHGWIKLSNNESLGDKWLTTDNMKLGWSGVGEKKPWPKYVVLDGGHNYNESNGKDNADLLKVTTEKPICGEENGKAREATYFAVWKVKYAQNDKKKDPNNNFIIAPGGNVRFGGIHVVFSLDAVWATLTAPENQIINYDENPHAPNMEKLTTDFSGDNTGNGFSEFLKDDEKGEGTRFLFYKIKAHPMGDESDTQQGSIISKNGVSERDIPKFTKPGAYEYTVTAYLNVPDPSNGKAKEGEKQPINNLEIGSVSFLFVILPRLTVNVKKALEGRNWTDTDDFSFTVSDTSKRAAKASVINDNFHINKAMEEKTGSAQVGFADVVNAEEFTDGNTCTITVAETPGTQQGMIYATNKDIPVKITKNTDGSYSLEGVGTPDETGNYSYDVTMINTQTKGGLMIRKEVRGSKYDGKVIFKVTPPKGVTFKSNGYGGETSVKDNILTVPVKVSGQEGRFLIEGLDPGEYTVTEDIAESSSFTFESISTNRGKVNLKERSATANVGGEDATAAVVSAVNRYTRPTGSLTVSKTIQGTTTAEDEASEFTFDVKFSNVPADGFSLVVGNAYNTTTGSAAEAEASRNETIRTEGQTVQVKLKDGESLKLDGIPVGVRYKVSEEPATGYVSASTNPEGTIDITGEADAASFTNYKTGSLTVMKKVQSEDGDESEVPTNKPFEIAVELLLESHGGKFEIKYGKKGENPKSKLITATDNKVTFDLKDGESCTISGIPVGMEFRVSENLSDGDKPYYAVSYYDQAEAIIDQKGQIPDDGSEQTVKVINTYYAVADHTGNLRLEKIVNGRPLNQLQRTYTFEVKVTKTEDVDYEDFNQFVTKNGFFQEGNNTYAKQYQMNAGESKVISKMPEGTVYEVSEKLAAGDNPSVAVMNQLDGRELGTDADQVNKIAYGKINQSRDVDNVTFVNSYLANLQLKIVFDEELTRSFNVPDDARYTFKLRFSGLKPESVEDNMRIVDADGERKGKSLYDDFAEDDAVTIALTKKDNVATIYDIPIGVSHYTITEDSICAGNEVYYTIGGSEVFDPSDVNQTGITTDDQTFSVDTDYVTFKNVYRAPFPGWLSISKEVKGNAPEGKQYEFEISSAYGEIASRTLKIEGGKTQSISLPAGTYTVKETTAGNFTTKIDGRTTMTEDVDLAEQGVTAVNVVNTYTSNNGGNNNNGNNGNVNPGNGNGGGFHGGSGGGSGNGSLVGNPAYVPNPNGSIGPGPTVNSPNGPVANPSGTPAGPGSTTAWGQTMSPDDKTSANDPSKKGSSKANSSSKIGGTPKTGDDSNIYLWIALMIVSIAGAFAVIFTHRKKGKDNDSKK